MFFDSGRRAHTSHSIPSLTRADFGASVYECALRLRRGSRYAGVTARPGFMTTSETTAHPPGAHISRSFYCTPQARYSLAHITGIHTVRLQLRRSVLHPGLVQATSLLTRYATAISKINLDGRRSLGMGVVFSPVDGPTASCSQVLAITTWKRGDAVVCRLRSRSQA